MTHSASRQTIGIHLVPTRGKWSVRTHDAYRAYRANLTQEEALDIAMGLSPKKLARLYVHGENGRITKRIMLPAMRARKAAK